MKRLNLDTGNNSDALGYKSDAAFHRAMEKCEAIINYTKESCTEVLEETEEGILVTFNAAKFADNLIAEMEKDEDLLPLILLRFARLLADTMGRNAPSKSAGIEAILKSMGNGPKAKSIKELMKRSLLASLLDKSADEIMEHKCDDCKGSAKNGGDCPVESVVRETQGKIVAGEVSEGKKAIKDILNEAAKNAGLGESGASPEL